MELAPALYERYPRRCKRLNGASTHIRTSFGAMMRFIQGIYLTADMYDSEKRAEDGAAYGARGVDSHRPKTASYDQQDRGFPFKCA